MAILSKGKRKTFKSLDEKIGFGLHANETIGEVLQGDKSYLQWMHEKTNNKLGKRLIKEIESLDEKYVGLFK